MTVTAHQSRSRSHPKRRREASGTTRSCAVPFAHFDGDYPLARMKRT